MAIFAQGVELTGRASAAARALLDCGARPGRPVAALTRAPQTLAVLAYAASALKSPLFPIDPDLPELIRSDLLRQARGALVLGAAKASNFKPYFPAGRASLWRTVRPPGRQCSSRRAARPARRKPPC